MLESKSGLMKCGGLLMSYLGYILPFGRMNAGTTERAEINTQYMGSYMVCL
jgi:hypothetical protein